MSDVIEVSYTGDLLAHRRAYRLVGQPLLPSPRPEAPAHPPRLAGLSEAVSQVRPMSS